MGVGTPPASSPKGNRFPPSLFGPFFFLFFSALSMTTQLRRVFFSPTLGLFPLLVSLPLWWLKISCLGDFAHGWISIFFLFGVFPFFSSRSPHMSPRNFWAFPIPSSPQSHFPAGSKLPSFKATSFFSPICQLHGTNAFALPPKIFFLRLFPLPLFLSPVQ